MPGQVHHQLGRDLVELPDGAERERPQKRAQRRRRRIPVNSRPNPPCRSRSRSSIESAPATIPATTAATINAAFGFGTVNDVFADSLDRHPQRDANASTGPAEPGRRHQIQFGVVFHVTRAPFGRGRGAVCGVRDVSPSQWFSMRSGRDRSVWF